MRSLLMVLGLIVVIALVAAGVCRNESTSTQMEIGKSYI